MKLLLGLSSWRRGAESQNQGRGIDPTSRIDRWGGKQAVGWQYLSGVSLTVRSDSSGCPEASKYLFKFKKKKEIHFRSVSITSVSG